MELIQKEIKEFFEHNWNGEVDNSIMWDTFKAYLRRLKEELSF